MNVKQWLCVLTPALLVAAGLYFFQSVSPAVDTVNTWLETLRDGKGDRNAQEYWIEECRDFMPKLNTVRDWTILSEIDGRNIQAMVKVRVTSSHPVTGYEVQQGFRLLLRPAESPDALKPWLLSYAMDL